MFEENSVRPHVEHSPVNNSIGDARRPESIATTEPLSLLDYLELFVKYKKIMIRNSVLAFVLGFFVAFALPEKYAAVSMILPPQQDSSLMGLMVGQMGSGVASMASDLLGKSSPAEFYSSLLQTDVIKDKIIDRFNLMKVYKQDNRKDTYDKLDKCVDINPGKKDGIVSIIVEDRDSVRAAEIANAYVDEVIKLTSQMSETDANKNKHYIEEQLSQAKGALTKAEEKVKQFQLRNKAIDITEQAKTTFSGLGELTSQLALEEIKLATLKRQFTDNSQEVKLQSAVINNIKVQINRLENGSDKNAVPSINTVPSIGQEYVRLMREFKIQEVLVEALTKQLEINRLSEYKDVSAVRVIQRARPADKESSPKRTIVIAAITIFGLFFTLVYAFLREQIVSMGEKDQVRWNNLLKGLTPQWLARKIMP